MTSCRSLPLNLKTADHAIFSHEFKKEIAEVYTFSIPNLLYTYQGRILLNEKKSIPKEFELYNNITRLGIIDYCKLVLKIKWSRKWLTFRQPIFFVTDYWSKGYFHWFADVLPRLVVQIETAKKYPVLLPTEFENFPYVRASIELIGAKVIFMKEGFTYKLKRTIFVSHFATPGNYNDNVLKQVANLLSQKIPSSSANTLQSPLVYISRGKASKRKIKNEEKVEALLQSYCFKTFYCEELSLHDQMLIMSQAKVLVSNHGAGLTNMLFLKEHSKVIELRNENDSQNNCYYTMACALNHDYYYLTCKPVNEGEEPHTADLIVDCNQLDALLNEVTPKLV